MLLFGYKNFDVLKIQSFVKYLWHPISCSSIQYLFCNADTIKRKCKMCPYTAYIPFVYQGRPLEFRLVSHEAFCNQIIKGTCAQNQW